MMPACERREKTLRFQGDTGHFRRTEEAHAAYTAHAACHIDPVFAALHQSATELVAISARHERRATQGKEGFAAVRMPGELQVYPHIRNHRLGVVGIMAEQKSRCLRGHLCKR